MLIYTYEKNDGPESSRGFRVIHMSKSEDTCYNMLPRTENGVVRWPAKVEDPYWDSSPSFTGAIMSRVVHLCSADGWYWAVFEHTFPGE